MKWSDTACLDDVADRALEGDEMIRQKTATTLSAPADRLCTCGGNLKPVAHHTGDGWTWGGECKLCARYVSEQDEPKVWIWPFDGDIAGPEDWRNAGYEVV